MRLQSFGIRIASPEEIRSWSFGEVISPLLADDSDTGLEAGGLFSESIFGPIHDYRCACGQYDNQSHVGVVCESCHVEVAPSSVRAERMGHIELAVPVAHAWYWRQNISHLSLLLNVARVDLEQVLYCNSYLVSYVNEEERRRRVIQEGPITRLNYLCTWLEVRQVLSASDFRLLSESFPDLLKGATGGSAVHAELTRLDLAVLAQDLRARIRMYEGRSESKQALMRLRVVEALRKSGRRPEWLMLTVLPVLPPLLRPLEGERDDYEMTSLDELYANVISINNRIKRLQELQAPETEVHSQICALQQSVDRLFYGDPTEDLAAKQWSLSEILYTAGGAFHWSSKGSSVDYSMQAVAIPGPHLKLGQCGLPKTMALDLFRPFVVNKLLQHGKATSVEVYD